MRRPYYLAAIFEVDPDHERWTIEPIGAVECTITYTSRPYLCRATALRAVNGAWGDTVAADATIDSENLDELQGFTLSDVIVVTE